MHSTRRHFIKTATATAVTLTLPPVVAANLGRLNKSISIGLIADLHQDIMHDAPERLSAFLKQMAITKPDALMQLGDFAMPKKEDQSLIDQFNKAHSKTLHVIGNHDTDSGFTKQQVMTSWGMKSRYYSTDVGGLRFIVLDGNDKGSPTHKGGYVSYIGKEQRAWLTQQLKQHSGPIAVVCHQPLAGSGAVNNAEEIQAILAKHEDKVVIAFNGHTHIDSLVQVGKIPYLHINSASYLWVGGKYKHESYSKEIHAKHHHIQHTCPYRDPLFTTMTFDPKAGTITIKGKATAWVGKSPEELDIKSKASPAVTPQIRARNIHTST